MAGVAHFQRELSGRLRNKTLQLLEDILDDKTDYGVEFKKQLLLRLAGSILPRIQENTGEDGGPIQINILRANGNQDNSVTSISG